MSKPFRLRELFMYLAVDEQGEEGIAGFMQIASDGSRSITPLVAGDRGALANLKGMADALRAHGIEVRLIRMEAREDISPQREMELVQPQKGHSTLN